MVSFTLLVWLTLRLPHNTFTTVRRVSVNGFRLSGIRISNMPKHDRILHFIATIRQSHPQMENIFTKGSCFYFYLILKEVFPEAEYYDDFNHVITKIDDRFYDITGEIDIEEEQEVTGRSWEQLDEDFYSPAILHFGRQDGIVGYSFRGWDDDSRSRMTNFQYDRH